MNNKLARYLKQVIDAHLAQSVNIPVLDLTEDAKN